MISEGKIPIKEIFFRSSLFSSYSCNFAPSETWLFIIAGVTWSKFHIEGPKILGATFQNLDARATCLLEFVHSCFIFLTIFRNKVLSQTSRIQFKGFSNFSTNFRPIVCQLFPFFILFIQCNEMFDETCPYKVWVACIAYFRTPPMTILVRCQYCMCVNADNLNTIWNYLLHPWRKLWNTVQAEHVTRKYMARQILLHGI